MPRQTVNVDLCFVPASHAVADKLPAVSGSSGRLVVQGTAPEPEARQWPGRVFEDPELSYEEAMHSFVVASQEQAVNVVTAPPGDEVPFAGTLADEKQMLRRAVAQLQTERRQIREQRKLEDTAWQAVRATRTAERQAAPAATQEERRRQRHIRRAADAQWQAMRNQRRATRAQRALEDELWRVQRRALRERATQFPVVTAWIAVLVVLDNCTRQCWGLPLFVAGAHVTAEMIVTALRDLLPPELQFLISDRGTHFKANAFQTLVRTQHFTHVWIARHRPQSNGIAERFVRTLKEWLAEAAWHDDQELAVLLQQFLEEYNDRPHQGLPFPGLSPNEFAKRTGLF